MKINKSIIMGLFTAAVLVSCGDQGNKINKDEIIDAPSEEIVGNDVTDKITPSSFGEELSDEAPMSSEELFASLSENDTVKDVIVSGTITSVCQKKGCWMKVDVGNDKEMFVRFKDYGFFMPLDCEGSTVVFEGKAYSETISVDELKHYAEDDGKSEDEIAAIVEPETTYSFKAKGALLTDYVATSKMPVPDQETSEENEAEKAE